METETYLKILREEIHSVVMATTDEKGLPVTRVIDIMLQDDKGIYFLTAKGKAFYRQLMNKSYVSLSGMTSGTNSMSKKAISIAGSVRNIGSDKREEIFKKNPYMATIYTSFESRTALNVFCLYKGQGEFFDLSTKPITRKSFAWGGKEIQTYGYRINEDCNACGLCLEKCPQNCIRTDEPYEIIQENCLHCGNCMEICPQQAVLNTKENEQIASTRIYVNN
ncbi:4Fe-4S binding protein [Labilibaculum sp.]|uniref:4Fe-4S binding protein n=1 Tax=Labilibaculum sp. TaxID=2060723 RepID=UPI00356A5FC2